VCGPRERADSATIMEGAQVCMCMGGAYHVIPKTDATKI
jgi:hypothetical protein